VERLTIRLLKQTLPAKITSGLTVLVARGQVIEAFTEKQLSIRILLSSFC